MSSVQFLVGNREVGRDQAGGFLIKCPDKETDVPFAPNPNRLGDDCEVLGPMFEVIYQVDNEAGAGRSFFRRTLLTRRVATG